MRDMPNFATLAVCLAATGTLWGSTQIHTCVTSGSGPTYMKVCISTTGALVKFESPQGKDHIKVYSPSQWAATGKIFKFIEGFSVCWSDETYGDGLAQAWSPGYDNDWPDLEDRWGAAYKIEQPGGPNTFPLRIYRVVAWWGSHPVGWELKQEFNRDTDERELTLTMTLSKRSGEPQEGVSLLRFADLDIDNDYGDDEALGVQRSAVLWEGTGVGNAVALTGLTAGAHAGTGAGSSEFLWWYCDTGGSGGPWGPADSDAAIGWYWSSIPAGGSKTVKLVYRAF